MFRAGLENNVRRTEESIRGTFESPNGAARNATVMMEHNTTPEYLGLSEAWESIPQFDGDDPDDVTSLIDACKNVKSKIDPAQEEDLCEAILNTKIQGNAAIVLKRNGVTTFEELIVQLRKLYPREIDLPKSCFKDCRSKSNPFTGQSTGYSTGYFARFEHVGHKEPCIHCGCSGHTNDYLFMWAQRNHFY